MSATPSSPETGDKKEKGLEEATVGWGSSVLIGILALFLVFHFFVPDKKSGDNDDNDSDDYKYTTTSTNNVSRQKQTSPQLDKIVVAIDGFESEYVDIPEGYYLSFICPEPYQIINAAGEKFDGEANRHVSIGIKEAGDTSNLRLKFRTRNDSKTTMRVAFTAMP